jgi:excisionase family DNA binding protein
MRKDDRYVDDEAPTGVFTRPEAIDVTPAPRRDDHQLWNTNDVARYLRVSRSWVYHRAEAGLLPLRRVGGLLRFDPAAIRAFATGEATNPASDGGGASRTAGPLGRRTRR